MVVLRVLAFAFLAMAVGLLFMGLGRVLTARLHRRYGPPFYQSYIDVIKCFSRKSISHHFIMDLGSMMGLAGLVAAAMFVPLAQYMPFDNSGSIVTILYLMPIGYLGMAMGVSASGNPLAAIGIARALTLMLGYEVPFAIIVLGMIASYDSSGLVFLQQVQSGGIANWNIWSMPFGFIAALIALQGMLAEKPFDTMIAPAEIASGPMVELSGKFLGLAFLQHAVAIYVETALVAILFLGGGSNPFELLLKMLVLYMMSIMANAIYARYRVEQAVKFLWLAAGGLALVQLIINLVR